MPVYLEEFQQRGSERMGGLTYSSLLIELVGGDEVNGEDNLDALCLCLLDEGGNLLRAGLVEEGVTDLCPNAQR